jgi:hypothetical protein
MSSNDIALTQVPRALEKHGLPATSYRRLYTLALDNRIPAHQGANGRWFVHSEDVPAIAAAMANRY